MEFDDSLHHMVPLLLTGSFPSITKIGIPNFKVQYFAASNIKECWRWILVIFNGWWTNSWTLNQSVEKQNNLNSELNDSRLPESESMMRLYVNENNCNQQFMTISSSHYVLSPSFQKSVNEVLYIHLRQLVSDLSTFELSFYQTKQ